MTPKRSFVHDPEGTRRHELAGALALSLEFPYGLAMRADLHQAGFPAVQYDQVVSARDDVGHLGELRPVFQAANAKDFPDLEGGVRLSPEWADGSA